jgi:hypothetical protein
VSIGIGRVNTITNDKPCARRLVSYISFQGTHGQQTISYQGTYDQTKDLALFNNLGSVTCTIGKCLGTMYQIATQDTNGELETLTYNASRCYVSVIAKEWEREL